MTMTMALIILTQQKEKQTWFDFLHIMILDEKMCHGIILKQYN